MYLILDNTNTMDKNFYFCKCASDPAIVRKCILNGDIVYRLDGLTRIYGITIEATDITEEIA